MFHDVEQNTDEWLALRAGKITGSGFGKVMANFGKPFGEPAKKYAADIALEQITGSPVSNKYSNEHMERGHIQEPLARMKYEADYFCDISNGGFYDLGSVGVSPDGVVGEGLIEIKSVIPSVHVANIKRARFDPAYKWQLIGNMYYTEKEWIDFISFCEDFPEQKQLYVYRLNRGHFTDEFEMMRDRIEQFQELIENTKQTINSGIYFLSSEAA